MIIKGRLRKSVEIALLKGAIFDLGGTLIHLTTSWEEVRKGRMNAICDALKERGVVLDLNDLKREYVRLHDEESDYSARTLEEIEFEESLTKLLDRLGVEMRQRPAMADLVKRSFALEVGSWVLFPGVQEMLEQVRSLGLKTGLLSNARSDWAVGEIVERLNLAKYFDAIVTSAAVGFRKPRPEPFQRILKLLDLDTSEVVMIGNSMEADIAGARPLGIRTIRVILDDSADGDETDPDLTVSAVAGIVPAIRHIVAGR